MKTPLFVLVVLIADFTLRAETFIGVTSATNRLVVGTNQAIIIQTLRVETGSPFQLVKNGDIYAVKSYLGYNVAPSEPAAIAGPCELIFTNNALLNFQRLTSTGIETIVLPSPTTNTASVTLNSGQTMRVFTPIHPNPYDGSSQPILSLQRGANPPFLINGAPIFYQNEQFSGPLTITFKGSTSGYSVIYSFTIVEDAQTVPQGVTVQSPNGSFQLMVEKSSNLTNWNPAILQSLTDEQKAFYRLRIQK